MLSADLVVDASGRYSQAPRWLVKLGYEAPPEEKINSGLGYVSRFYARPEHFPNELPENFGFEPVRKSPS